MECCISSFRKFVLLFLLFGYQVLVSLALANSSDYSFVNPRANVGIPYSIWVDENSIWIGGENGLVDIRAEKTTNFVDKNYKRKSNWVTDISDFSNESILVSVFGNGLYLVNKSSHLANRIDTGKMKNLAFWKVSVGDDYFAVSTLNNIIIYDKKSKESTLNFVDSGIPVGNQIIDLVHDEQTHTIWWLDVATGLSSYSFENHSWAHINISKNAGTIYSSLEKNGEDLLVGTNKGLVIINSKSQSETVITERANVNISEQPVRTVFIDKNKKIWVGAETLYIVDQESNRFVEQNYIRNNRGNSEFLIVTDLAQDQFGNIYAVDTVNDFMVFSKFLISTDLYRPENLENDSIVDTEFSKNSNILINVSNSYVTLLTSTDLKNNDELKLIRGPDSDFLFNKNNEVWSVKENKIVDLGFEKIPEDLFNVIEQGFLLGNKLFILSDEESKHYLFEVVEGKLRKLMDHVVATAALTSWNSLLVAVTGVGIFEIDQYGNMSSLNFGIDHSYNVFTSFSLDGNLIILGTSGSGYFVFDYNSKKLVYGDSTEQFVRDAISLENYWLIATNRGLYAIGKAKGERIKLDENFGILDSDFDFDGISDSSDKVFVKGDKNRYILDKISLLENLSSLSVDTHPIDKSSLSFVSISEQENKDSVTVLEGTKFEIHLPSFNYIARNLLKYEFLLDNEQQWEQLDFNSNTLALNQLPSGTHTLRLRVHDPRSYQQQPVTLLNIKVRPPWWRSWQALVCYGVLLTIIIFVVYWNYRKRIREQGAYLTALVNEKNRVLEETNDSIKRMLERKQTAFSNLSHELRTPLSLILGPLSQLKKMVTSSKALEHLRLAERNAGRIQVLLDQMLEVERLDHVKTLPVAECDIAAVTQCILYDLSALAEIKHQSLNWQCTTREKIHLYTGTLEKILMNLVSNAVKYTDDSGEIHVEVKMENLQLIIQVADNGIGMTEAERARIFERYTRFNDGENGAGVGLALVKELVTANGGWINVTSEQGRGTCFVVTLPMLNQLQNDAIEEPNLNDYEVSEDVGDKQAVILVVDDNQEMRSYLQSLFANNYTCLLAHNGENALTIIDKIRPDLIITDYKMPVMNGLTLANRIRTDNDSTYIPIIMLSAFGDSGSMVKGLQANIDYYLTKPINEETLLLTVTNLLDREQTRRSKTNELVEAENDWPLPDFVSEREQQFYFKLMTLIEKMYGQEHCTRMEVAQQMAMSDRHLQRKVKALFGKNFTDFLREFRMSKAKDMLEQGKQITQVVYDVGFTSPSYFSRSFKDVYGMTPSEYQKHHYKPQIKPQSTG